MKKSLFGKTLKISIFTVTLGTLFCVYSAESMKVDGLNNSRSMKISSHYGDIAQQTPIAEPTSFVKEEIISQEPIKSDTYLTVENPPIVFTYGDREVTGEVINGITYYSISDIVDTFNFTYAPSTDSKFLYSVYIGEKEVQLRYPYYLLRDDEMYLPYRFLVDQLGIQFIGKDNECKAVLAATKDVSCYKEQYMFEYNRINQCELFGENGTIAINTLQSSDTEQLYTICINDMIHIDGLAFNLSKRFAVTEVSGNVIIAVSDLGISDDYTTTLYLYSNNDLQILDMVGGLVDGGMLLKEGFTFDENGYFYSEERMKLLHTGWFTKQYKIDVAAGLLEEIPTDYYKIQGEIVLLRDFDFYTSKEGKEKVTLKTGTTLLLTATDNKAWVSVRPKSDPTKEYWMTFTESSNFYLLEDGSKEGCSVESVFDGLVFAD